MKRRWLVLGIVAAVAMVVCASLGAQQAKLVDLDFWIGASVSESGPPPDDWVAYKIVKEKLGINWTVSLLPSTLTDQDTKINAAAAANNLPDSFQVNRDAWYKLAKAGLLAPVDKILPLMPVRTKTHYDDAIARKLVTIGGQMWGLPEPGQLPMTDGFVVRQDWLTKLNLKVPTTLDEFLTVARAFTFQDPDGNGKADTYGFGAYLESSGLQQAGLGLRFEWIFGAYGVSGTWNVSSTKDFGLNVRKPGFYKAVQFIKSMIDAKVIDPDWATIKKDEYRARWKQGRWGMMHENFAALSTKANYADFDKNFPNGLWLAPPPPKGPDGKSTENVLLKNVRIQAISARAVKAGKTDAIAKLLEWMANPEGYYLLGFGQEGINYKKDAKGYVIVEGIPADQQYTAKAAQPLTQLRNLVFINSDVELAVRYVSFKTASGRTQDPLSYWNAFRSYPYTDSTGAAIINPPSNAADFTRFYSENIMKFVLGQQPLNETTWADFLAGLDKLGARELEATAKATLTEAGFLD
jgi:putative aldouronate transport system substrate-binding protein